MKTRLRVRNPNRDTGETSVSLLLQSSKLTIKELEKIAELISETLSTTLTIKLQMERKDLRVTSSVQEGISYSLSEVFRF